jgi:hypothetical protein
MHDTDDKKETSYKWVANLIKDHVRKMEEERKQWAKHIACYRGDSYRYGREQTDGGTADVTGNHLFAFTDSLLASVCPPNPEVNISPRKEKLRKAASMREALVNDFFHRNNIGESLWRLASRAVIYPRSFSKVVWSSKKGRPLLRVVPANRIFFDQTADDWEDIRYIIEATTLTKGQFQKRMRKKGRKGGFYRHDCMDDQNNDAVSFNKTYPDWLKADPEKEDTDTEVARAAYEWIVVYEVYDLVGERFYHCADNVEKPLYSGELPYQLLPNPFFRLAFNDNLEDLSGMSDASLVYDNIKQLNELSTLRNWHARTSIPIPVVHEGLLDDPDEFMDALEQVDGPGQVVIMNAKPNVRIGEVMGATPTAQLPIQWTQVMSELNKNIEFVLGLPAYQRGELGASDVATELALADTAIRSRNTRRQLAIYNVIEWAAKSVLALYAEFLPADSNIPLKLSNGTHEDINRLMLAFKDFDEDGKVDGDSPWDFDFRALPYNADEANTVVQLKKMEAFLPLLQGSQMVDQKKLMQALVDLLKLGDIMAPDQPPAPPTGAPGMGMPPGMPPGMEQPPGLDMSGQGMPAEAIAPIQGGQVEVGTGSGGLPAQQVGGPLV